MTPKPQGNRLSTVTSDDHGANLEILTWVLLVIVVLATGGRIWVRFVSKHIPGYDDAMVALSFPFWVGMTVTAIQSVRDGFGKRDNLLSQSDREQIEKDIYVNMIMFYFVLATAKAAIILFIHRLAVAQKHIRAKYILAAIVSCWFLAGVFGAAFQNPLPHPWIRKPNPSAGDGYFDMAAFIYATSAVDVATDLALIFVPSWIVWDLQMLAAKKWLVFFAFMFRFGAIGACILRVLLFRQLDMDSNTDYFYNSLNFQISTQLQACVAIAVSCIPALKPFMDQAWTGGMVGASFAPRPANSTFGLASTAARGTRGGGSTINTGSHASNNSNWLARNQVVNTQRSKQQLDEEPSSTSSLTGNDTSLTPMTPVPLPPQSQSQSQSHQLMLRPDLAEHSSAAKGGRGSDSIDLDNSPMNQILQTKRWDVQYGLAAGSHESQKSKKTEEQLYHDHESWTAV